MREVLPFYGGVLDGCLHCRQVVEVFPFVSDLRVPIGGARPSLDFWLCPSCGNAIPKVNIENQLPVLPPAPAKYSWGLYARVMPKAEWECHVTCNVGCGSFFAIKKNDLTDPPEQMEKTWPSGLLIPLVRYWRCPKCQSPNPVLAAAQEIPRGWL